MRLGRRAAWLLLLGLMLVGCTRSKLVPGVTVGLKAGARPTDVAALAADLQRMPNVRSVEYKTDPQSLVAMSGRGPDSPSLTAQPHGQKPLPATLVVRISDPSQGQTVVDRMLKDPNFLKVIDDPAHPLDKGIKFDYSSPGP